MGLAESRQEAFWEACGFGHVDRAEQFLKEGDINVNWVSYTNDCCAIHVASQGKIEIVKLLLRYKCDVNVRDNCGNLPLHHAAMKGHTDIVQLLIENGSRIDTQDKNGWTPLHKAAYWCHPDVVQLLIDKGADVNIKNMDEKTALHECARSRQKQEGQLGKIATLLIKAGSDINSKSSDWGEADLTCLMFASFHNHPAVATALIDAGCDLNAVGTTFWSALHWAADRGNEEIVYILLEAGIDPTLRDMKGDTALERCNCDAVRDVLKTAIDLHKEMKIVETAPLLEVMRNSKPTSSFKPACKADFKSTSFLPKDWKPSESMKDLLNKKKTKLASMNSKSNKSGERTSPEKENTGDNSDFTINVKVVEKLNEVNKSGGKDLDNANVPIEPNASEDDISKSNTVGIEKTAVVKSKEVNIEDKQVEKTGELDKHVEKTGELDEHVEKTGELDKHVEKTGELKNNEVIDKRSETEDGQSEDKVVIDSGKGDATNAIESTPDDTNETETNDNLDAIDGLDERGDKADKDDLTKDLNQENSEKNTTDKEQ